MNGSRYFYSTDGTDAHGPVTAEELRQLINGSILGATSYVCLEGATQWEPLDAEKFQAPPMATPPPFNPTKFANQVKVPAQESIWDNTVLVGVLYTVAVVFVVVFAGITALMGNSVVQGNAAYKSGQLMGAFTANVFIVGAIPYFLSRFRKGVGHFAILFIGIFGLGIFTIVNKYNSPMFKFQTQAAAMAEQEKSEARKEIAKNGFYSGDPSKVSDGIEKLKDLAGNDDSPTGQMIRDGAGVMQDMLAKVKVSNTAEVACGSFDPGHLNSTADIDNLRIAIGKLRATQTDVLDFLNSFDDHCRAAFSKDNINATETDGFISGARKSGHIDQIISIWKLKIKLSDYHVARLDFLEKNWDSFTRKDGKLLFKDDANLSQFRALTVPLHDDIAQMKELQRQIYQ